MEKKEKKCDGAILFGLVIGLFVGIALGFQGAYIFSQIIISFNENNTMRTPIVFFIIFGVISFLLGEFIRLFYCRRDFIGWYIPSKTLYFSYIISFGVIIGIVGAVISFILFIISY